MDKVYVKVVKFVRVLFQFFGLFPLLIDDRNSFSQSKLSELLMKCWSFVWIISISVHVSFVVSYQDLIFNDDPVGKVNDFLKFASLSAAYIVLIIESLYNTQKFKSLFKGFERFDLECKILGVDFEKYRLNTTKAIARQYILIQSMHILVEIGFWLLIEKRQWKFFWLVNFIPAFVCRIRHLQYIFFLHLIQSKILLLQEELGKIVANSRISSLSSNQRVYEASLEHLQIIKNAYGILWKTTFNVNDWYVSFLILFKLF